MGQPAHLKKQKQSSQESIYFVQMARSCTCRNASRAPINNSGTFKPTPAIPYAPTLAAAQTPVPAQVFASIPASASVLGLLERYTDENLQEATKLILELFVKNQKHD